MTPWGNFRYSQFRTISRSLTLRDTVRFATRVDGSVPEVTLQQTALERAERRVAHLEAIIEVLRQQVDSLREEVDALRGEGDSLRESLYRAEVQAQEYHTLMSTKSMRLLRRPRAVYARVWLQANHRRPVSME
jgi:regulator of replication initiation timing